MTSGKDPGFRFVHPVPVRFRDIDVGGHAHHSQALIYLEEARWAFWEEVAGRSGTPADVDYILAEARVRYRDRILYPDTLQVGVRVATLGRKHFEMDYEVRAGDGRELVLATTVQVMFDYEAGASVSVPDDLRGRLEAWEGGPIPRRRRAR